MQITDCKEDILHMGYYDRMPNTALGLSLNSASASSRSTFPQAASPLYKVSPPHRSNQAFNAAPLSFLAPNMAFKSRLDQGYARQSPPVQLELLPLRPTSHKPSVSPSPASPSFLWQQQISAASFSTQSPMITRGIDVNQLPSSADHDDLGESSPTGVGRTSESSLLMKRERERSSDAEQERTCEVSSRGSDEEGEGGGSARKKLRLSKEQSTLLEESFKEHSTLNPKQKAELAKQLNLRPRQVEVWFQNRRARTKLKQTEVDCELLKRCCESLTEENRRLQKEVQELRAIKVAPPCVIAHDLYMPLPAATLTMCPSCERLATHAPDNTTTNLGFAAKATPSNAPHHLHHHHRFSQQPPQQQQLPSAAC